MKIELHQDATAPSHAFPGISRRVLAFTLVEVMVAVGVVAILFTSLYAGITSGFGVINQARENLRATQIMQDRMEEMRLYTWDQVTSFGSSTSYIPTSFTEPFYPSNTNYASSDVSSGSTVTNDTSGAFMYYGSIVITNAGLTEDYSNDVKLVTVTIVWTNGAKRSRTMSTYFSQYGMQNYLY